MAFCQNCGTNLSGQTGGFCPNCGTPLNQQSTSVANVAGTNDSVSKKSRLITFLLAFFLGSIGAHNFYLGRIGKAVSQLLLTILGTVLFIGGFFATFFRYAYAEDLMYLDESEILSMFFTSAPLVLIGLLMLAVCGIWVFVEWIMALCGGLKDKQGLYVKKWME